jgi:hypothetical protein
MYYNQKKMLQAGPCSYIRYPAVTLNFLKLHSKSRDTLSWLSWLVAANTTCPAEMAFQELALTWTRKRSCDLKIKMSPQNEPVTGLHEGACKSRIAPGPGL